MPTFPDALAAQLRRDPGRPFLTFYDHASGERTELSVTTYANWVAKAASLLVEEAYLGRGARLHIDLPPHWMSPVFLGAAWTLGATVVLPAAAEDRVEPAGLEAVVTGPDGLERWRASSVPAVLACSLHPLGRPFDEPLPAGVMDVGREIWGQPDAFTPWDRPTDADAAVAGGLELTQGEMMRAATAGSLLTDGGRLLSVADPASPPGTATVTEPLVRGGSLVLVRNPDPARMDEVYAAERATARA